MSRDLTTIVLVADVQNVPRPLEKALTATAASGMRTMRLR
jgi:hypothetical protein